MKRVEKNETKWRSLIVQDIVTSKQAGRLTGGLVGRQTGGWTTGGKENKQTCRQTVQFSCC